MKKHFFFLLFALAASLGSLFASGTQVDGIWYDFDSSSKTASVTYRGSYRDSYSNEYTGEVVIPASVTYNNEEYNVTSIGDYAFWRCSGLTSVTIPNSVTSIGYEAFQDCSGLTSVTIPESVTSIGDYAFYKCTGLTSVTIPNSVTSIGNRAFYGCGSLTSVTLNSSAVVGKTYTSSSNIKNIFGSQVTEYIIGDDVTSIGGYAFGDCTALTSVTIGNSVTSIGSSAFSGCSGLTSVTIPNSVTSIGERAFEGCSGLTSVTLNSSAVVGKTYKYDSNLQTIFGSQVTEYIIGDDVTSIGNKAFYNCYSLTSVTIPNSVTSIGNSAFYKCIGLTSVTIPNSVTSIGSGAFSGCSGLTSIEIPNSVTSIGDYAFYECTGLTSVYISDVAAWCAISFGTDHANPLYYGHLYVNEELVTDLVIPEGVTSIGQYAFAYCRGLTSVTIPNSVTSIGEWAFSGCTGLTSMTIPNSVTSIGNRAFYKCTGLTSVAIGNSVTSIGGSAFSGCSGLTSVTIGNSVLSIGGSAFYECTGLTSVTIPNSVTSIGDYAFYECTGLTSVTIPNSVTSIGEWAFSGCTGLTSMTIPNSVTSIGNRAFGSCERLTDIYVECGDIERIKQLLNNDSRVKYPPVPYTITIYADYGSITTDIDEVTICDFVTCSISPNLGYHFTQWSDGNKENPRIFQMTQDTTFTAEFTKNTYTITTESSNPQWGTTAGDNSALYLDEVEISATANYGYHFVKWNDDNTSNPRTISVTEDKTYTATFAKNVYTITLKNAEHGSISGDTSAEYLDEVTLTANPDLGYHFTQWSDGNKENPRIFQMTQDTTFTAEFTKNTYTIITESSNPKWGTTAGDNSALYLDEVEISATANYGYHFVKWNDDNTSNPRTISVTEGKTFTATFAKNVYTITLNNAEHGSISGDTSAEYLDEVTLTANPDYGYHFTQWSDGNTDNPRTFVLTQDTSFTAEFAINNYTIETQSSLPESGIILGEGSYEYLSQQTVTAIPNYGYHFVKWVIYDTPQDAISVAQAYAIASALGAGETTTAQYTIVGYVTGKYGSYSNSYYLSDSPNVPGNFIAFKCVSSVNIGQYVKVTGYLTNYKGNTPETTSGATITPNDLSSLANPFTFTLRSNISFVAEFAKNVYTITKNAEHGYISGNTSAKYLDQVTLTAKPEYGYHFTQWSDGVTDNPRTIVLTQDTTFTAEFAKNTYTITTESSNPKWGTTAGDNSALYLDEVEISATANYGYHFVKWNDDNTSNPRTISVTEDKTYTATFAKNVYTITLNNAEHGTISGDTSAEYLDEVTLTANPDYGYHFTQWSDGNKENPRTFVLTQDTTFTAEIVIDRIGTCGDENALTWTYDPETKTLTITGNGALNSNYTFGVEAPAQMQKLVIGNEVTAIGDSAFYGMSTINHLIIGGSVATIGDYAFAECRNFDDITCLANVVPVINETTFANVGNKQYIYLFVPAERERAYHRDTYWGEFDIQVQQAEETTVTTNDVTVEPQDNAVTLTWPTNDNAASYTIEITKDGVLFCTLTFNANGQLTGIAFAPSRDGHAHAPAAVMTANGLQFTVTGLDSNTQYGYSVTTKDANNQPIATYSGEFTTTGEIATGIDNIQGNEVQSKKFVRDGQVFILRGDKTYTLTGQEIIVP